MDFFLCLFVLFFYCLLLSALKFLFYFFFLSFVVVVVVVTLWNSRLIILALIFIHRDDITFKYGRWYVTSMYRHCCSVICPASVIFYFVFFLPIVSLVSLPLASTSHFVQLYFVLHLICLSTVYFFSFHYFSIHFFSLFVVCIGLESFLHTFSCLIFLVFWSLLVIFFFIISLFSFYYLRNILLYLHGIDCIVINMRSPMNLCFLLAMIYFMKNK